MPVTAAAREVLQSHFGAATLKSDPEKYRPATSRGSRPWRWRRA